MKKLSILLLILFLSVINLQITYAEEIKLNAKSYILMEFKSGQVLYEHNADQILYPASTTKMLTGIIALEKGNLDQIMTASQAAVNDIGKDGMNIGIMAGEELKLEDLLNALLVRSANETANIIAENIAPTRQAFVDMMNQRAKELGATSTHFANPCGAHEYNHYTTARDMITIARHGMTIPKFREIVGKKYFTMSPTNKHSEWPVISSTNHLLGYKSGYYTKSTGIKTGYTDPAGNNLISSAVDTTGMELIAAVMDVPPSAGQYAVFKFSQELLEYGFKNFSIQKLVDANNVIKNVPVINAKDDASLELVTSDGLECVLPNDKSEQNVLTDIHINPQITAPVTHGDVVGYIEYKRNDIILGKVNIIASKSVEEKPPEVKLLEKITSNKIYLNTAIVCISILLGFIVLRFFLRRISRNRVRKIKY